MQRPPRAFLPLKPLDLQLLLSLAAQERHGYGLVQDITERTEGLVALEPGNLYRVIKRLVADGLVAETDRRTVPELDERRRYYRITPLGGRVLAAEIARLRALVSSPSVKALVERWAT